MFGEFAEDGRSRHPTVAGFDVETGEHSWRGWAIRIR